MPKAHIFHRVSVRQKRSFIVGLAVVAALAAIYFQASAVVGIAAQSTLSEQTPESLGEWSSAPASAAVPRRRLKDATPILKRNPFDSVTGPLIGVTVLTEDTVLEKKLDLSDPLGAPRCDDVRIYSTVEATDPKRSTVVAQFEDANASSIVRVGDVVGERRLAFIGYNRRELSPAAWFVTDSELCQSLVFSERPRFKSKQREEARKRQRAKRRAEAKRRHKKKRKKRRKKRRRRPPKLPKEIAKKLERVSPGQYRIDRSVVDTLLSDGPKLMRSTKIVPVKKNGHVAGMRVFNVPGGTLLSKLGFKNGDQITSINGLDINSPEKALRAYARLRSASDITVQISRKGKPVTLDYRIR